MNKKPQVITGLRYLEIMWPLNDMFRARLHEIGHLPYDTMYEAEADKAISDMAENAQTAWADLSLPAWRVLLERHAQMALVAIGNAATGNPLITLPPGPPLSDDELRVGLALLWLLRMKLPFPTADRSSYEFPATPVAKGH